MTYAKKDMLDSKIRTVVDALIDTNDKKARQNLEDAIEFFKANSDHDTDLYNRIYDMLTIDLGLDIEAFDLTGAQQNVAHIDKALGVETHIL